MKKDGDDKKNKIKTFRRYVFITVFLSMFFWGFELFLGKESNLAAGLLEYEGSTDIVPTATPVLIPIVNFTLQPAPLSETGAVSEGAVTADVVSGGAVSGGVVYYFEPAPTSEYESEDDKNPSQTPDQGVIDEPDATYEPEDTTKPEVTPVPTIKPGSKLIRSGVKVKTPYAYTMKKYAKVERAAVPRISVNKYLKLIDPAEDTTHGFQYLRVDTYRAVDKKKFKSLYNTFLKTYCAIRKISPKKSVLYGKADVFLSAAKSKKIDPVYFISQTFCESAYGTSKLSSGMKIKKVALKSFKRNKKGKFYTKKLKKKVKVYNLYGIKAYDSDPYVGGSSYAYYKGWASVNKAIYGAAGYLRTNYIHGYYKQNTPFKLRYTFRKSIWHQYATGPTYAKELGQRILNMSSVYKKSAKFTYDYPKYK